MPAYDKEKNKKLFSLNDLKGEYGRKAESTRLNWKKGDIILPKNEGIRINCLCDKCNKEYTCSINSIEKFIFKGIIHTYCPICANKVRKKLNHGDERYNNRKKAMETNIEKYGMVGSPRKGINKNKEFSQDHKNEISKSAKKRLKNKENHPMYGKKHTEEAKEKNRKSNILYLKKKGVTNNSTSKYDSGQFYSVKNNEIVKYRSSYEKWFYYMLENNIGVKNYKVEEFGIDYIYENKSRLYFPDVLINFNDGRIFLIEIKPTAFLEKDINIVKWDYAKKWCSSRNINFEVLTEENMLLFIFKNSSTDTLMSYPKDWIDFILGKAYSIAENFIERSIL